MKIECRFGSGLTVIQPGEPFAVAEEKLDLEPRSVQVDQPPPVQLQIGLGQDNIPSRASDPRRTDVSRARGGHAAATGGVACRKQSWSLPPVGCWLRCQLPGGAGRQRGSKRPDGSPPPPPGSKSPAPVRPDWHSR